MLGSEQSVRSTPHMITSHKHRFPEILKLGLKIVNYEAVFLLFTQLSDLIKNIMGLRRVISSYEHSLVSLPEDLGSIPSTYRAAHNCVCNCSSMA